MKTYFLSLPSILQQNSLYCAARFANVEGILGFPVASIILVKALLMQITT